jgi:hypothetical protein
MLEDKLPAGSERELTDADLDLVSAGTDNKPAPRPRPKPITGTGMAAFLHIDGIDGESMDGKHKGE